MRSPSSAGARRLPSGAVEVAGVTIAVRGSRVWLHQDQDHDGGPWPPEVIWTLAGELHQAATLADRAELAAQVDPGPVLGPPAPEPTPEPPAVAVEAVRS